MTEKDPAERGDAWTFVGFCRRSKLVISYCVGKRNQETTDMFMMDLRKPTKTRYSACGMLAHWRQPMQLVVVVLATVAGLLAWGLTVTWCAREAAEERADRLARAAAIRKRWLAALRDLVG